MTEEKKQLVRKDGQPDRRQNPAKTTGKGIKGSVSHFTEEDRIRLMTRAALVGISKAAAEEDVSPHTLNDWCYKRFREDYFDLREKAIEQRKAFEAERHMELAAEAMALEAQIGKRIMENVDEIPVRDLAGAHRNMATSAGIHTDKFRDLRGEGSTLVVEHRNPAEIIRALVAKGAGDLISPELRKRVDVTIIEEEAASAES